MLGHAAQDTSVTILLRDQPLLETPASCRVLYRTGAWVIRIFGDNEPSFNPRDVRSGRVMVLQRRGTLFQEGVSLDAKDITLVEEGISLEAQDITLGEKRIPSVSQPTNRRDANGHVTKYAHLALMAIRSTPSCRLAFIFKLKDLPPAIFRQVHGRHFVP
jgi:hypothetical protein